MLKETLIEMVQMLQISSAQGPAECELAVRHALRAVCREAESAGIAVSMVEEFPTSHGYRSVLLELSGAAHAVETLVQNWAGSVQWICASPMRVGYPRKNWFIGVQILPSPKALPDDNTIVFQTCKASGKGGQHVNKTESAVRATHTTSGLSVKVQTERSQHANKRLARELLGIKLAQLQSTHQMQHAQAAHVLHGQVERGNPIRVFCGEAFQPR